MSININSDGTIFIHSGDSGEIVISGLSTDKNYKVYFAIKDSSRKTIGEELSVDSNYKSYVKFFLSSNFTDLLKVSDDEGYAIYHYGIKLCADNQIEDTLFVANSDYGQLNNVIVFPKKVEGYNG